MGFNSGFKGLKEILREGKKGREDEEGDVSRYWITLRKRKQCNLKEEALDRSLWRTVFEKNIYLSQDHSIKTKIVHVVVYTKLQSIYLTSRQWRGWSNKWSEVLVLTARIRRIIALLDMTQCSPLQYTRDALEISTGFIFKIREIWYGQGRSFEDSAHGYHNARHHISDNSSLQGMMSAY